jgi:hypothetical protein
VALQEEGQKEPGNNDFEFNESTRDFNVSESSTIFKEE